MCNNYNEFKSTCLKFRSLNYKKKMMEEELSKYRREILDFMEDECINSYNGGLFKVDINTVNSMKIDKEELEMYLSLYGASIKEFEYSSPYQRLLIK